MMKIFCQNLAYLRLSSPETFAKLPQRLQQEWADYEINDLDFAIEDLILIAELWGFSLDQLVKVDLNLMEKAKRIKLLLTDVDGVMTDGGMYYSEKGDYIKKFNAKDGLAIQRAQKTGLEIGFISSSTNVHIITDRANTLKVKLVHVGEGKKEEIVAKWLSERNLSWEELAYIGDDLNDAEVLAKAGISACPADAVTYVRNMTHCTLKRKGGEGCVREFLEDILQISLQDLGKQHQIT